MRLPPQAAFDVRHSGLGMSALSAVVYFQVPTGLVKPGSV
jgi:hypothetical protein